MHAYRAYLQEIGVDGGAVPAIRIESTPPLRNVAFPDLAQNQLVIGAAFAATPDTLLHEYSHLVLERAAGTSRPTWGRDLEAVETGLAYYLPCSYKDDPRLGFVDLTNRSTSPDNINQAHATGFRWAAAFWQIRTRYGRDLSDKPMLTAWRQTLQSGEGTGTRFIGHLSSLLEQATAPAAVQAVQEAVSEWGLPHDQP